MLKRCSDKKDLTEWNQWREAHPDEKILLEGAELQNVWLKKANLQYIYFKKAKLQHANLRETNLNGANLFKAYLQKAYCYKSNLQFTDLWLANLRGAYLIDSNLKGSRLWQANLQGAKLQKADLQHADFSDAKLQGANFWMAIVDGKTIIWKCSVDCDTDFEGVGLANACIDPGTKQLLDYNIRRDNWKNWYRKHRSLKWPVRWFWQLSDYGLSTWRVIIWFFALAFFFAVIYANLAYFLPPGVVKDLHTVAPQITEQTSWLDCVDYGLEVFFRPIYFSVVTMTTLGFGDMYARKGSWLGHVLLTVQVILGYVLLAALVTRFAILFAAGGPAGTFAKREKEETTKDNNIASKEEKK